jgi:hypothetical protein
MNFESDIEWFPAAGGITKISRWRKSPVRNTGLPFVVWQGTGGLHHRLISDVPPGQTPSRTLKVHNTL